jgi:hypothetical protein
MGLQIRIDFGFDRFLESGFQVSGFFDAFKEICKIIISSASSAGDESASGQRKNRSQQYN